MNRSIRVLLVEDSEDEQPLLRGPWSATGLRLTSPRRFSAPLSKRSEGENWDVVLIDYTLPGFSGR